MRIRGVTDLLGAGGHGSIQSAHYRIRTSRRIVDGRALCRMFHRAIRRQTIPKYLSSDHDPLYRFHQWQANLRVLGITEIKTVPYVPISHPFVERTDWNHSPRVPGPYSVLDSGRPGIEAIGVQGLLQSTSHSRQSRRQNTGRSSWRQCVRDAEVISMERTLSRIISDAHGGIITNSPCTLLSSAVERPEKRTLAAGNR